MIATETSRGVRMNEHRELEKWTAAKCSRVPTVSMIDGFERLLGDAHDERPLQTYLAQNGALLSGLVPMGGTYWLIDRPRFGSELVPDFLLASTTSVGILWTMVELESPTERVLTNAGVPAAKAAGALKQVRDWRSWVRDNIAYANNELGFRGLDAECKAAIIIGRRATQDPKQAKIYRELSDSSTMVMSFDRVVEHMKSSAHE